MARSAETGMILALEAKIDAFEKALKKAQQSVDSNSTAIERRTRRMVDNVERETGNLKIDKFIDGFREASDAIPGVSDALGALAGPAAAATAAMAAVTLGIDQARKAIDWGDEMQAAADHLGITAEALQELEFAAGDADVDVAKMREGIQALDAALGAMLSGVGSGKISKVFAALNITPEQLKGMRSASDLLPVVADRISQLGSRAEQVQIAKKLGIEALLPMLKDGAAGLEDVTGKARDLGQVVDNETVAALAEMSRQIEIASGQIDNNLKRSFAELAPLVVSSTNWMAKFTEKLGNMVDGVSDLMATMGKGGGKAFLDAWGEALDKGLRGDALDEYVRVRMKALRESIDARGRHRGSLPGERRTAQAARAAERATEVEPPAYVPPPRPKVVAPKPAVARKVISELKVKPVEDIGELFKKRPSNDDIIPIEEIMKDFPSIQIADKLKPIREELHAIGQTAARELGVAIAYGEDLGDALESTFRQIAASWITNGLEGLFARMLPSSGSGGLLGGLLGAGNGWILNSTGLTGARAMGGPVAAGGRYLVGERGPELFVPKVPGFVVPNHDLRSLRAREPSATVQPVHFDLRGAVVTEDLLTQMNEMARQAAIAGAEGGRRIAQIDRSRAHRRQMF